MEERVYFSAFGKTSILTKLMQLVKLLIVVATCGFEKAGYSDGKSRT